MSHPFIVHGLTDSYFTRKVRGYHDHKSLRWHLSAGPRAGALAPDVERS